jgi:hypothetical protein
MWVILGEMRWMRGVCMVCSRFLSCSMVICRVHVVIIVGHVLSHYCSMSFLCTVVALLVVLCWWPRRGGYCFAPFYVLSLFSYCVVLQRLLEYCLVAWILGDVVFLSPLNYQLYVRHECQIYHIFARRQSGRKANIHLQSHELIQNGEGEPLTATLVQSPFKSH